MGNLDRGTSSPFTLRRFRPISRSGGEEGPLVLALLEPPLDTSGTLQLILNGGSYLPGLHHLLSTMQPGEAIHGANVDAGYGVHESTLVFEVSNMELEKSGIDTSRLEIGTVLGMGNNGMECRVTHISDDGGMWTLDANTEFAGCSYEVDITLDGVEEGPTNWEYYSDMEEDDASRGGGGRYGVATFALGCFWGGGGYLFSRISNRP